MTEEQATAVAEPAPSTQAAAAADERPPSGEQAPPQEGEKPVSKPRPPLDANALQAGLYRQGQTLASYKRILGLPAKATDAEIETKLNELVNPAPPADPEYDPEFAQRESEILEREWTAAERVTSPEQVALARHIQELALTKASPLAFVDAVGDLMKQYTDAAGQQQSGEQPGDEAAQQQAQQQAARQRADDISPEGDAPVGWTAQPEQEERGSGDMEGGIRKMLSGIPGFTNR